VTKPVSSKQACVILQASQTQQIKSKGKGNQGVNNGSEYQRANVKKQQQLK
jgi:hypothetical protein